MKKLTIFTPVFNREVLIKRLYESLKNQKFQDFEWLIVDDGSTDNTKNVIDELKRESNLEINYFFKKNGGKHSAYNFAIDKAKGELFIIIDSDDIVLENGLKDLIGVWDNLSNKDQLLGISGLDIDKNNRIIGDIYPKEILVCSHLEMREKLKVKGDKSEIYVTELLKGNYFPIYKNEKFLTEAILFDKLYSKYNTYFVNKKIIIRDYQVEGLSDNSLILRIKNPLGAMNYYKQRIDLSVTKFYKFRSEINYIRFALHSKQDFKSIRKYKITSLIGYIFYKLDCKKTKPSKL